MKEVINNLEEQMTDAWSEDSVDGCILVAEQYAIEKQIELLDSLATDYSYTVRGNSNKIIKRDIYERVKQLQQQLQKLKDGK